MSIEIDQTKVPRNASGAFYKRPKEGPFYLRFYPFKRKDGSLKFAKHVVHHWIDGKRFDCTAGNGKPCQYCEKQIKPTHRKRVAVVDRQKTSEGLKLYDMPITLWDMLNAFLSANGESAIGDKGVTFAISYDSNKSPASQYSMSPLLKDKQVLKFDDKLLPYDPPVKTVKVTETDEITDEELFSMESKGEVYSGDAPQDDSDIDDDFV
uniref:Bacteriophage T4 Gp32 single-stranded DNA-binding domain-containing protein n=1 Tax=viral metagenome TaxID=1070528 RepID=A0A6H2A0W7_9ZZZZ